MSVVDRMIKFAIHRTPDLFPERNGVDDKALALGCFDLLNWARRFCKHDRNWVFEVQKTASSYSGALWLIHQEEELSSLLNIVESKYSICAKFKPDLDTDKRTKFIEEVCQKYNLPSIS